MFQKNLWKISLSSLVLMKLLRGNFSIKAKVPYIYPRRSHMQENWSSSGIPEKEYPFKYFGVPIIKGRLKTIFFSEMVSKVRKKVEGWQGKLLAGRTVMIKHVLSSIPLHMLAFGPPSSNKNTCKTFILGTLLKGWVARNFGLKSLVS